MDVKSGFRFDIKKQFNQQNSEVSSVDIKVPWELGRMQYLPNLSIEILSDNRGVEEYKNQVLDFQYKNFDLEIPHKKLTSRNFVLFPLQEISPLWQHPKTKEMISTLIQKLPELDRKSILKIEKN